MKKFSINDQSFEIDKDYTILQFLLLISVQVPRFCYHEQLSIAGNCRVCLIEDIKSIKPIIACAINIADGLNVYTQSVKAKKAREAVLEYLLINHPLDCPICDQGGECDLQDLSLVVGGDKGRFYEAKRVVSNKNFGSLIKTIMNRCIHCTRCVRFATEVVGFESLGITGRGSLMEIGFYVDTVFEYGASGNVIDLCPVGALTSKIHAFVSRPWELISYSFVDIFSGFLYPIVIEKRGIQIIRVLPQYFYLNLEGFISDKIRFCFDSLKNVRLTMPYINLLFGAKICKISWSKIIVFWKNSYLKIVKFFLVNKIKYMLNVCFWGSYLDVEALGYSKNLLAAMGSPAFIQDAANFKNNMHFNENLCLNLLNSSSNNDCFLILNVNVRLLDPLLHIKFRKAFLEKINFYYIGSACIINFYIKHVFNRQNAIKNFLEGKTFLSFLKPFVVCDLTSVRDDNILSVLNVRNLLYTVLFYNTSLGSILNHQYLLNVHCQQPVSNLPTHMINLSSENLEQIKFNFIKSLNIYFGHHKDIGSYFANIICPIFSIFEKKSKLVDYFSEQVDVCKVMNGPILSKDMALICRVFLAFFKRNKNSPILNNTIIFSKYFVAHFAKFRFYLNYFTLNKAYLIHNDVFFKSSKLSVALLSL